MKRWAFDLEFEQPQGKVNKAGVVEVTDSETEKELGIEVGAAVFDTKTGEIIGTFEGFVNNNIKLSTFIRNLTNITQEQVDGGKTLREVMKDLDKWLKSHGIFRQPVCWGIDAEILREECMCNKTNGNIKWQYGKGYMNVKTVFQMYMEQQGKHYGGGIANSMETLGLKFEGVEHRAVTDAINTARMYVELARKFK